MKNIDDHVLRDLRSHIMPLRNVYNNAVINNLYDDGAYSFKANNNPGLASLLQHIQPHLPRAELLTLIDNPTEYDDDAEYKLHPDLIKQIDPDVYTMRDLFTQLDNILADRSSDITEQQAEEFYHARMLQTEIARNAQYLTPKLLKSLLQVPNKPRAIQEIADFFDDNKYRIPEDMTFDSLGSIRRAIKQFQDEDRKQAETQQAVALAERLGYTVIKDLDPHKPGHMIINFIKPDGTGVSMQEMVELAKQETNAPYEYSDDVKSSVDDGWRLFESPEDQVKVGCELGHCYGDTKRYGTAHKEQYTNKIRGRQSILLTKGNITAEIAISSGKDGIIDDTQIVQIQGPNNTPVDDPSVLPQIERIADSLVGKNVNSMTPEQVEGEVSDIICKHLIKTTPANRNIVSALHRRF